MSENVDLVRSIYPAWERGDFSVTDWMHPEIEFVIVSELLPTRAKGLVEARQVWGEAMNSYKHYRVEAREIREIDEERVLVLAEQSGRGKASGILISRNGANLFHLRGGKVVKLVLYEDRAPALADLGVEE